MIPLALLAPLVFSGGSLNDLARSVAAWTHQPVVSLVQAERARERSFSTAKPDARGYIDVGNGVRVKVPALGPEWKPARMIKPFRVALDQVGDGKELTRLLRIQGHIEASAKEGGVALWDAAWQPSTTFVEGDGPPLPDGWKEAEAKSVVVKAGRVTAQLPPNCAVRVGSLKRLAWSKPLKVHWLFEGMWVVPAATNAGERETLSSLATAVSGRLIDAQDGWRIDFDATRFRPRAQAAVASRAPANPRNPLAAASYDIARQTWYQIDDDGIVELFKEPRMGLSRPVRRGSPLASALGRYLVAYRDWTMNPPPEMRGEMEAHRSLLSRIDPDGEPRVILTQNLGAGGGWPRIGGGTIIP